MGGGRCGAASRRYRRYEESFFPGADSHPTRHARSGGTAEGGGGAASYHDACRGDARARGSRGADSASLAIQITYAVSGRGDPCTQWPIPKSSAKSRGRYFALGLSERLIFENMHCAYFRYRPLG